MYLGRVLLMINIGSVKQEFLDSIADCRALFVHCISTAGPHKLPGVEAAFLQMHSAWEIFLEESLLNFLCGQQPLNGTSITPAFTVADLEVARKILYQEKPYTEWTNVDNIQKRLDIFLGDQNVFTSSLLPFITHLKDITKIRNAIAHTSITARKQFNNLVQGRIGGRPAITRPADFLIYTDPQDSPNTFFDRYANALEMLANNVVGP